MIEQYINIKAAGGAASIEIEVYEDAGHTTPIAEAEFGDTIYIVVTPTNITPTGYTYIMYNDGVEERFTDGASTSYVVNMLQDLNIQVLATDDIQTAENRVSVTINEVLANTDALINDDSLFNGSSSLPDGTAITDVTDQSGASNDFAQSTVARQPQYYSNIINSLPAIKFGQTTATHLYSTNAPDYATCYTFVFQSYGTGTATLMHVGSSYNDGANLFLNIYFNSGPIQYPYVRNAGGYQSFGKVVAAGVPHVLTVRHEANGQQIVFFLDGKIVFTRLLSGTAGTRTATYLGGAYINSFKGYIGHFEQQSGSPSDQEIYERHRLLADKWGITL